MPLTSPPDGLGPGGLGLGPGDLGPGAGGLGPGGLGRGPCTSSLWIVKVRVIPPHRSPSDIPLNKT